MDYHRLQADAKDENRSLLAVFAAIIAIVAAAAAAVVTVTVWGTLWLIEVFIAADASSAGREVAESELLLDRMPWVWVYAGVFALTAAVMVWISHSREQALIATGGPGIARSLGGRRIDGRSSDTAERRFVNTVEEMAIAARRPAPTVFVLDREPSINAFNAGWTDETTAIGITSGALAELRREELQAVAAQAMAHVFHGDARLNLRLMALVTGVAGLAIVGEDWIDRAQPDDRDREDGVFVPLLVGGCLLYAVGWIGVWLSTMAQRSMARRHELLADATAVELLRQSEPVRDALRRVGGHPARGRIRHRHARTVNHLFMVDAGTSRRGGLHPDLRLRVLRLDPSWRGEWLRPDTSDHVSPDGPIPTPAAPVAPGGSTTPVGSMVPGLEPLSPAFDAMTAPLAGLMDPPEVGALGALGGATGGAAVLGVLAGAAVLEEATRSRQATERPEARTTVAALVHLGAGLPPTDDTVPDPCSTADVTARIDYLRRTEGLDRRRLLADAGEALRADPEGAGFADRLVSHLDADRDLDQWMLKRLVIGNVAPRTRPSRRRPLERLRNEYATVLSFLTAIGGPGGDTAFAVAVGKADLLGLHPRRPGKLHTLDKALDKLASMHDNDCERALAGLEGATHADGVSLRSELEFIEVVRLAIQPPDTDQASAASAACRPAATKRSWRSRLRARSV